MVIQNIRRPILSSTRGVAAGTYHPDPTVGQNGLMYNLNALSTIFNDSHSVLIHGLRTNMNAVAVTVDVETTNGVLVCRLGQGVTSFDQAIRTPFLVPGGFRLTTSAPCALMCVWSIYR